MPFIPHTEEDVAEMLNVIGVNSIDQLFDEIPAELRIAELKNIPAGLTEMEATRLLQQFAKQDQTGLCFLGAGAYEHHIPAAVWDITSRGEFMTAYTPYQAEASQGTLQLLYEFQTMMANLTGMDVSNASLYDGGSAVAEAILMAVRANRHAKSKRVLVASTLHPHYLQVAKSIVHNQEIELISLPYDQKQGRLLSQQLAAYEPDQISAVIIPQPNFFGVLEEVDALTDWAHAQGALVVAAVNPTSLALFKEPGAWGKQGADIVCGEGQPLGIPLASGGPYFGFLCCKQEFVRQMPGRIIGRTVDVDGREGFALTLQAREQHIRRSKATSNICTNQGLMVTAASIYMSIVGAEGLRRVALASHANTQALLQRLTKISGVVQVFAAPFFHEVVVQLPKPINSILPALAQAGIQGGFAVSEYYSELNNCLLVCATETKTSEDIEYFGEQLEKILS